MELSSKDIQAKTIKVGDSTIELAAGQRLQVRYGTAGNIFIDLDQEVPVGKKWTTIVYVRIEEVDA